MQSELTTTGLRVQRAILVKDLIVGLVNAVVSIPGGIANGVLAGVNPVYGLYSLMVGTPIAALFTSSVFMNVDAPSATSLTTLDAVGAIPEEQELAYLVVLGLLVGLFMILFGVLRLGFLVRFISNSVMTGFLSGLGILTILGQVGDAAHASDHRSGQPVPGVAQGAIQMGQFVAKIIRKEVEGGASQARPAFTYFDKGSMAIVGRGKAVAAVGGLHLSGFLGWLIWIFLHFLFLVSFRRKLLAVTEWVRSYVLGFRNARLITGDQQLKLQDAVGGQLTGTDS